MGRAGCQRAGPAAPPRNLPLGTKGTGGRAVPPLGAVLPRRIQAHPMGGKLDFFMKRQVHERGRERGLEL